MPSESEKKENKVQQDNDLEDEFDFEEPEVEEFVVMNDEEEAMIRLFVDIGEYKRLRFNFMKSIDVIRKYK